MLTPKDILNILNPMNLMQTKRVLHVNPTTENESKSLYKSKVSVYSFNANEVNFEDNITVANLHLYQKDGLNHWFNIDYVNQETLNSLNVYVTLDPLAQEDILSEDQRPKMDELVDQIFCVMQMMYLDPVDHTIDSEQVSFVLTEKNLISLQDDDKRDHFGRVREKLNISNSKCRTYGLDYLLYSLLDAIVDNYYDVMEKLSLKIEQLEEQTSKGRSHGHTMSAINSLRKEIILYRRNILPVKDLLNSLIRTDNKLIKAENKKYFRDVLDHVVQAIDLSDNYRDVISSIRDLHINQVNLKTNEAMKFLTIVTALLAPATVIGGIFGMNFEKIPYLHNQNGFWIAASLMVIIPSIMMLWFKKKGWF